MWLELRNYMHRVMLNELYVYARNYKSGKLQVDF